MKTTEQKRLDDVRKQKVPWKKSPTGSGRQMNLYQVAEEISNRLARMFLKGKDGRRPVNGDEKKLQEDPHWNDYVQFYEYFHGDSGAGLGANHQTGWTGVIARAMHLFSTTTADRVLELGKGAAFVETEAQPNVAFQKQTGL